MQQASAAFTSAEAEVFGMQRTSSDQSAVSSSTQHDSDAVSAHIGCCDSCFREENLEADHARDSAVARYSVDTVHYSRHQVNLFAMLLLAYCTTVPTHCCACHTAGTLQKSHPDMYCVQGAHHRPAVTWQSNADILQSAQSRHSPQHLMLSPKKSCLKQVHKNGLQVYLLGMSTLHLQCGMRT